MIIPPNRVSIGRLHLKKIDLFADMSTALSE